MEDIVSKRCGVEGCDTQSAYPDAQGNPRSLCAEHAEQAGTHIRAPPGCGASKKAMQCFDRIERLLGIEIGWRIRLQSISNDGGVSFITIAEGKEKERLVPGSRIKPDGFQEDTRTVWLFHGNFYHGFPLGHPHHERECAHGASGHELWERTMEQHDTYLRAGCAVRYIWEHEYDMTQRASYPRRLQEVVRRHTAIGDRPREGELREQYLPVVVKSHSDLH